MAAESGSPTMKPTLGLTGLTVNAMALIAPGAFLWLTYSEQAVYGQPWAGAAMWIGIVIALCLCFSTAVSYSELSKLYPGAGSSYVFAEQSFLAKHGTAKFSRLAKFVIGWASHLYYWIYPGVMVAATAVLAGYMVGQIAQHWGSSYFNAGIPSPLFMFLFCILFAFGVAYIAYRGVTGATAVNIAINVIQITALTIFAIMAIAYRVDHSKNGAHIWALNPNGHVTKWQFSPNLGANGKTVYLLNKAGQKMPITADWSKAAATAGKAFQFHRTALGVIAPHTFQWPIIQAGVAILLLVGFESVTSMGDEAKNPTKDIPKAVILSLIIQGAICYLFEYFAANYFLNSAYGMTANAATSSAPIGDMMQMIGAWAFGSPAAGWWFMFIESITVFLALIGTTLSCMNTGARVTYAMGRDDEVPSHFGMLHGRNLTPHKAIWTLATISAVVGIFGCAFYFCGGAAQADSAIKALPHNIWYSFGIMKNSTASAIPQGFLVITLVSNFGTFMLYMLTNIVAIVAFREHHMFNGIKHFAIPLFGLLANFACMLFYIIGPSSVPGMSWKEPYIALGVAALWGIYGAFYFMRNSKKRGRAMLVTPGTVAVTAQ